MRGAGAVGIDEREEGGRRVGREGGRKEGRWEG